MPVPDRREGPERQGGTPRVRRRTIVAAAVVAVAAVAVLAAVRPSPSDPVAGGASVAATPAEPHAGRAADPLPAVDRFQLRPGQAPATALREQGLAAAQVAALTDALGTEVRLRALRPRDVFYLYRDPAGAFVGLELERTPEQVVRIEPAGAGYAAAVVHRPVERSVRRLEGVVRTSLYEAMLEAGGTQGLLVSYADLFAWDFDFYTDTRAGDRFDLLVEERRVDGRRVGFGTVLAGRYRPVSAEEPLVAFRFDPPEGEGGYYDGEGNSIRRAFLKSPLNFSRISSHFSYSRMHPILKKRRPHLGIDYAAPAGTPVVALGNGTVAFAGWIRGFGKTVKVRHARDHMTQYAHLSRFPKGISRGVRVSQGQVIGYVGSTGLSTGPHLDFRVSVGGKWINPLRLEGGRAEPLAEAHRPAFGERQRRLSGLLEGLAAGTAVPYRALEDEPGLAAARLDTPQAD